MRLFSSCDPAAFPPAHAPVPAPTNTPTPRQVPVDKQDPTGQRRKSNLMHFCFDGAKMKSFSIEERKNEAEHMLEEAKHRGRVCIQDQQEQNFVLTHEAVTSPLAVKGIPLHLSLTEILQAIHEGRRETLPQNNNLRPMLRLKRAPKEGDAWRMLNVNRSHGSLGSSRKYPNPLKRSDIFLSTYSAERRQRLAFTSQESK
jgi:hypothetical protein